MKLIIAEKPVLGRSIADAIPENGRTADACIYKGDYAVVWAYGHLLELKEPHDYDASLKKWSLSNLPINFPDWGKKPNKKSGGRGPSPAERLEQIGGLLKQAECVINAGDPDEEGQYLIDEIIRWFDYKGPVYRMETGDTTKAALNRALNNLKDNRQFENDGWSAYARSVADLMVGVNLTRYFTLKNQPVMLSIGRVQTPTLGLVVNRDLVIEGYGKIMYCDIFAELSVDGKKIRAKYEPNPKDKNLEDGRILDKNYAQQKVDMLAGKMLEGVEIKYSESDEQPPLPFNLVELQTYCSKKFGYEPSEVMSITQSLRDKYSAITYNRSDCQYLSEEQYKESTPTMVQVIKNISFKPKGMDMSIHSRCFNDKNITAHTAIIPQNQAVKLEVLTEQEKNVYLAVCKYYMAQFMPSAKKGKTQLTAALEDKGKLTALSTEVIEQGYLYLFKKDPKGKKQDKEKDEDGEKEDTNALTGIQAGKYAADVTKAHIEEKETKPPARYTKATLNKDMTRIAKYVKDAEVKKLLLAKDKDKKGENGSIGTVATRADIIDKLVSRGFLEVKGKNIISTPLGREFYRILPEELTRPDMTAYWWAIQENIRAGEDTYVKLTDSVLEMINRILKTEYPQINPDVIPDKMWGKGGRPKSRPAAPKPAPRPKYTPTYEPLGVCPRCGGNVVEGARGFGCMGFKQGCGFVIWKQPKLNMFAKTVFTAEDAKKFLAGEKVVKKELVSKAGKTFSAMLVMKDDPESKYGPNFELNFDFEKKPTKKEREEAEKTAESENNVGENDGAEK